MKNSKNGDFFPNFGKNLDFIEKIQKLDISSRKSDNLGCTCDRSNYDEKEIEFRAVMRLYMFCVRNRPKLLQLPSKKTPGSRLLQHLFFVGNFIKCPKLLKFDDLFHFLR